MKRAALEFSTYEDLGGLLLCSRFNTEFVNMLAHIKYLFWTLFGTWLVFNNNKVKLLMIVIGDHYFVDGGKKNQNVLSSH